MDARLEAAQRGLIWLLVVTSVVLLICLPRPGDAHTANAFDELSQFARAVQLDAVETTRREQAMHFAQVPLTDLLESPTEVAATPKRKRTNGAQGPKWQVAEGAAPVLALANMRLANLADVHEQSVGAANADVGVPNAETAKTALAFRVAQLGFAQPPSITGATLELAEVSAGDVQFVQEAELLRKEHGQAKEALQRAEHKVELAQKRVDARKKRRSKSTTKFLEQLAEATAQRDERAAAAQELQTQYDAKAEQAIRASEDAPARAPTATIPDFARLRVTLSDSDGKVQSIALAVPIERRQVNMPPLVIPGTSGSLPALRASHAWDELKSLAPNNALETLRGRLSWQSRTYPVLGAPLQGSWLLQLAPCFVALALFFAWRRMVGAATSHRLFSTEVRGSLRPVGFKKRSHELAVVVLLPLLACACAALSLWLLRRLPLLPATALFVSFPLAFKIYAKLDELRVLKRSIAQYHSYPPPAQPVGFEAGTV